MTTGNEPARSSHGRAGFQPRRKRILLCPRTACAASPAQSPHCGVDVLARPPGSVATNHPISNSQPLRLEPIASDRKQTTATKSNSQLWPLSNSVYLHPSPYNLHRAKKSLPASIVEGPARQPSGGLIATVANSEFELTYSQHAIYENSNRNKFAVFEKGSAVPPAKSRRDARVTAVQSPARFGCLTRCCRIRAGGNRR
jgi:hypothetical protein